MRRELVYYPDPSDLEPIYRTVRSLNELDTAIQAAIAAGVFADELDSNGEHYTNGSKWAYDLLTTNTRIAMAFRDEAVRYGKSARVNQEQIAARLGISTGLVSSILNQTNAPRPREKA